MDATALPMAYAPSMPKVGRDILADPRDGNPMKMNHYTAQILPILFALGLCAQEPDKYQLALTNKPLNLADYPLAYTNAGVRVGDQWMPLDVFVKVGGTNLALADGKWVPITWTNTVMLGTNITVSEIVSVLEEVLREVIDPDPADFYLVYRSPSAELRRQADKLDRQEAAIRKLRELVVKLKGVSK